MHTIPTHDAHHHRDVGRMLADILTNHPGHTQELVKRYTREGLEGQARMALLGGLLMRVGMMPNALLVCCVVD